MHNHAGVQKYVAVVDLAFRKGSKLFSYKLLYDCILKQTKYNLHCNINPKCFINLLVKNR